MMDDFPCTQCGECCRHVDKVFDKSSLTYQSSPTVIKDLIDRFPYEVNEDGSCSMLDQNGLCKVYHSRPILCNVKLGGLLLNINLQDWYLNRAKGCNDLITNANLNPDFLINLEELSKKTTKTYEDGRTSPRKKRKRKSS